MNRVAVYDPFAAAFPELFRGFLRPVNVTRDALDIRMDVTENATEYTVYAEMPGVAKEDIQVQIDGNKVSIAAEVKRIGEVKPSDLAAAPASETKPPAAHADRALRSERYFGALARSFAVASDIDEDKAVARFENGVLTLILPKKAVVAARRLMVH